MLKRTTICALILIGLCAFFAVDKAKAQTVWGKTAFHVDQNSRQLYGYHATELDYWAWVYYDAYVEGFIRNQFGATLDSDSDLDTGGLAEAFTQITYAPGQTYYVISDHYVGAYYSQPGPGGVIQYANPFGFGFSGPSGGYRGIFGFSPGPPVYTTYRLYYLGWTGWELVFKGEPHIDQMVPASAPLGVSIEVNFSGTNFGLTPTINVGGSGVTVGSITYSTDTRITAIFNIASNASTGNHSVSVSASGYTSNSVNLMVGDRTPQINSINPSRGSAGEVVPVTISGLGFGSNPIVNVGGGINVSVTSSSDQQITANFSIPSTTLPGDHQVRVTSNGVGGTGFVSGGGSSATSNAVNFTVNAQSAPRIISYSPQSAQLGVSIEINVIGENFGTTRSLQISGQGVTVQSYTSVSDPDHQIVAILNVAANAETGNHSITVSAGGLTSNSVNFQVGDRTPHITTITPPFGLRGTTTPVVVTGSGFGINPTLQVSGTGVNVTINSASDTRIDATFVISSLAETLTRMVTVTSRGASGNGFVQTPGANPNATVPFDIKSARVKINSVDAQFAPSVERLDINYTITPVGTIAPFARLEIFKKGDDINPIFRDESIPRGGSNIQYSQGGTHGWDGIANQGPDLGNFIGPENSPFKVRITIAADATFANTQMNEREFKVEVDSIETTPTYKSEYKIIKPQPTPTPVPARTPEIETQVKAVVKLKDKLNTKGGVPTRIPFKLHWNFVDADDTAGGKIDRNGDQENDNALIINGGKSGAGSVMWKQMSGITTTVDSAGQSAVTDVIVTPGLDLGSATIIFLSSNVAGDNYILKLQVKTGAGLLVGKETKFAKWSVRKSLTYSNFYKMKGGVDVKSIASHDNVDQGKAFSGDGYTDYTAGRNQTDLTEAQSKDFVVPTLPPNPLTDSFPELPAQQELTDFNTGSPTAKAAAKAAIEAKAQHWYQRNTEPAYLGQACVNYANSISAAQYSIIGGRWLHEKFDGRDKKAIGVPDYYPEGIRIIGSDAQPHDPDLDWGEVEGGEAGHFAFIFLNTKPLERQIIAARHEVGHGSDHELFGPGDHDVSGLMHSTAEQGNDFPYGNPFFSEQSIRRLRGWKR
jgi:hypothetical protein